MLGLVEPTIAIICACVPTLRPIFRKCRSGFPSIRTPSRRSSPTHGTGASAWTVPFVMLFSGKLSTAKGSSWTSQSDSIEDLYHGQYSKPDYMNLNDKSSFGDRKNNHTFVTATARPMNAPQESHAAPAPTAKKTSWPSRTYTPGFRSSHLTHNDAESAIGPHAPSDRSNHAYGPSIAEAILEEFEGPSNAQSNRSSATLLGSPMSPSDERNGRRGVKSQAVDIQIAVARPAAIPMGRPFGSRAEQSSVQDSDIGLPREAEGKYSSDERPGAHSPRHVVDQSRVHEPPFHSSNPWHSKSNSVNGSPHRKPAMLSLQHPPSAAISARQQPVVSANPYQTTGRSMNLADKPLPPIALYGD